MLYLSPTREAEAVTLASYLRDADRREVRTTSGGKHPVVVLPLAVRLSSKCYTLRSVNRTTGRVYRRPAAIVGVAPCPESQRGLVWLMASDLVNKISVSLMRSMPKILADLCDGYSGLECMVDTRNALHYRWVLKLGFIPLHTRYIDSVPFVHMHWSPPECVSPQSPPSSP